MTEAETSKSHTVVEADHDIRLDRWFKRHFPAFPHAMLEKSLRKGAIRVDGKKIEAGFRVQEGQVIDIKCDVSVVADEHKKLPPRPMSPEDVQFMQRMVLYKDEHVIIVNKPFGIAVQGGSKITRSIDGMLDALSFGGERPKLVHRLDRDTTGVLVLARTTKAAQKLMKIFASRQVEKTYWALVNGLPELFSGTVNLPLSKKENPKAASTRRAGPDGRDYEIMQVDHENGQSAVSEFRVLDHLVRKFALMELKPQTGRTHQLRVHMQAIGCPIVGDPKYGGSMLYDEVVDGSTIGMEDKLHLHARRIQIPAGALGKAIDVVAPIPSHMRSSFEALGIHPPKK
jgi:23S rRNA pseudouridine955/2504/2580 synthase